MLPRVSTSVQLVMTLGTSSSPRYWRIKIAMLPCDSEFLGMKFKMAILNVDKNDATVPCLYHSSGRLPAVFHYVNGFSHDFQLDGHNQSSDTSTCQSGLLHLFPYRIGQQTGKDINLNPNYKILFPPFIFR
jgi:hypothetical protein